MDIQTLFAIQKQLNDRIIEEHHLANQDLFKEKLLAFIVEIGELANETRCFKYWSRKSSSERAVILEEYVDGLHFALTLGLTLETTSVIVPDKHEPKETLTEQFLDIIHLSQRLEHNPQLFQAFLNSFFALGAKLGFTYEEIEGAYLEKNKVNHERQDNGY
ncbi:dUTP diphosphatase [Halalkalibacter akibai]|uniref:Dimeric dUTPase n=1 Tax=Halalkalibacter akibai (strain ATCC 43226 / DSM 21942 / CIP 109018 / JCM 9157 / 1139) TaxID=1236973 RepID=W4QPT7_HALA3|nr:dUTP diphosphatase [Halalkalibacter akibai]GAE34086.1 dimeric dUTPase [Halalkalibacter akibai JCM 9157]